MLVRRDMGRGIATRGETAVWEVKGEPGNDRRLLELQHEFGATGLDERPVKPLGP